MAVSADEKESVDLLETEEEEEETEEEEEEEEEEEGVNDCPIEEVRLTVPITDDPSMPTMTFRTWSLGVFSCVLLSFINQFYRFRQNPVSIGSISLQLAILPVGKLMAATLPAKTVRVPMMGGWSFSLNPGPFNMKEHVLITVFANVGSGGVYAIHIFTIFKAFYKHDIEPIVGILLTITTQMLGYGWAGIFRKFLVDSPYMWWPATLVQVSMFRALHEKEVRPKGNLSSFQFFIIALGTCFAYSVLPAFFFPSLTALSFICWIWPKSITAQQLGAGVRGLGLGSFALDWNVVTAFLSSPLSYPPYSIICSLMGAFLALYVLIPLAYWTNSFEARRFPIFSSETFDEYGNSYNVSRILNSSTFDFNQQAYDNYSKVYVSIAFAFTYGASFATLAASLSHVALFDGKSIWRQMKSSIQDRTGDVYNRLMEKYDSVPQWWFYTIFVSVLALSIFTCEGFSGKLQLPYWGILLAISVGLIFTLPIGIITATTNQQPGLNVITELIIGYLYPGRPIASVSFKTYGYISMVQAIFFLSDLKLGHYMKIPPRSMFLVQMVGTLINNITQFSTAWWLLHRVENICDVPNLPKGSPWTCPGDHVFYSASIIWGVVGPLRMFGKLGVYVKLNWFFLIGLLSPVPVWWLSRKFPRCKWIRLIHMPLIFYSASSFPEAKPVNYWTWGLVGIFFNVYVYRKYRGWWARHNYVLSAALDAGVAFMSILIYFVLQKNGVSGPDWWGSDEGDHCPLATCPTHSRIRVHGCPSVS